MSTGSIDIPGHFATLGNHYLGRDEPLLRVTWGVDIDLRAREVFTCGTTFIVTVTRCHGKSSGPSLARTSSRPSPSTQIAAARTNTPTNESLPDRRDRHVRVQPLDVCLTGDTIGVWTR
jgi:hypothetical protein